MSKKSPLVFLSFFILAGIALASGLLFPDTPGLPRFPTGPGTIGGFLSSPWFHPDGTVVNTESLSGVAASGYLQNTICDPLAIDNVWVGVDILGHAKCGHRITPLAMIGKFTYIDGNVEVMKTGTNVWVPANLTDSLSSGDVVRTPVNGSGTITFDDDLSILRLDVDTLVELRTGSNNMGQSVAEAILQDGSLWGRVLSNTGINLGGGGMVAGIRGTSMSIEKVGNDFVYSLVDSKDTYYPADIINDAIGGTPTNISRLSAIGTPTATRVQPYMNNDMDGDGDFEPDDLLIASGPGVNPVAVIGRKIVHSNNSLVIETGSTIGKVNLLAGSTWVRENIKKDIVYLDYMANSGSVDPMIRAKASDELAVAIPKNLSECNKTTVGKTIKMGKNPVAGTGILNAMTACAVYGDIDPILPSSQQLPIEVRDSIICTLEGRNYWQSLSGTPMKCQESGVIALADYTMGNNKMYYNGGASIVPTLEQKHPNTWIYDNGNFKKGGSGDFGASVDGEWNIASLYAITNTVGEDADTIKEIDIASWISSGWTSVYFPNTNSGQFIYTADGWDKWKYPHGIYLRKPSNTPAAISGGGGITISATGQYISYPLSLIPVGASGLVGRKVKIELENPIGTSLSTSSKWYVADLGSSGRYFVFKGKHCNLDPDSSNQNWLCNTLNPSIDIDNVTSKTSISIPIVSIPTQFIIGNTPTLSYGFPIGTKIKRIVVE